MIKACSLGASCAPAITWRVPDGNKLPYYKLEFRQRIPNVNTTGSKNHLSKRLFRQQV